MYIHPAFRIDPDQAFALLRARGFGMLVVADTHGRPAAVHVPFLAEQTAEGGVRVELHVARANRLHEMVAPGGQPALLTCQAADAYISPDWYGVPNQVPTWTYSAVHLNGTLHVLAEAAGLAHVDRLSTAFEHQLLPKKPWTSDKMDPARRAAMMRAIVSLELIVLPDGIEAQSKLIQHKGAVERQGAIAGLRERGDAASMEVAAMMERTLRT